MNSITDTRPDRATRVNPTLELHVVCEVCHPTSDRALCGSALHGIPFPDSMPATCVVCPAIPTCPSCGARNRFFAR